MESVRLYLYNSFQTHYDTVSFSEECNVVSELRPSLSFSCERREDVRMNVPNVFT